MRCGKAGAWPGLNLSRQESVRVMSMVLVLVLSFPPAAGTLPSEREKWTRYDSPHFTAFSRTFEGETRKALEWLELLRLVLSQITPDLKAGQSQVFSPLPTYVFLFPNQQSFRPYQMLEGAAGLFSQRQDGCALIVEMDHPDALEIVRHEYLHFLLHNNFPQLPVWLNEGLAEFFSTLRREGNKVIVGDPHIPHIRLLHQNKLLPAAEILGVTYESPVYQNPQWRPRLYASAWLLVHYLAAGEPARQAQLGQFLDKLRAGEDPQAAFSAAFQATPEVLDAELQVYRRRIEMVYPFWKFTFSDLGFKQDIQKRDMTRTEVLAWLGWLLAAPVRGKPVEAKEHLEAALELGPGFPPALRGLGLLELNAGRNAEALSFFRRAALADKKDHVAPFLAARLLMMSPGESSGEGPSDSALDEAAELLKRSLEIQPSHPEARKMLDHLEDRAALVAFQQGADLFREGNRREEGLRLMEEGAGRVRDLILKQQMTQNLQNIKNHPAELPGAPPTVVTNGLVPPLAVEKVQAEDPEALMVQQAIVRAKDLKAQGEAAQAIALLEETGKKVTDEFFKAWLQNTIREVNTAEYNRLVGVFNAGIKKFNSGDYAKALPLFEEVAAKATDKTMKERAQKLVARCKTQLL